MHAVIMAGGAGTRFWPASRAATPKQLLPLAGRRTMIQDTVERLEGLCAAEQILVVTNERLVAAIREQLPQLPPRSIVGEPCKRDTAPCIGWAAAMIHREDPEATMLVMPSDHVIAPHSAFQETLRRAAALVEQQPTRIVTIGIRPTYPAESFGYVEQGAPLESGDAYRVERFREKPDAETAAEYLASGRFFWNSGIFVWKAATILEALRTHEPEMAARIDAIAAAADSADADQVLRMEFEAIEAKSIDYAVMERHRDIVMLEAPFRWDDLGSWQAMARLGDADDHGNSQAGRVISVRTSGSIVRTSDDHLVVTLGVKDLIVVHTPDATLVAHKDDEESIREVVRQLQQRGWDEHL